MAILMLMAGWPVWVALTVYALCGMLGMVSVAIGDAIRPGLLRCAAGIATVLVRLGLLQTPKNDYLHPTPIPPLSERRPVSAGE